jgi:hypothetical protein
MTKRTITQQKYLEAFALFTMATQHYAKCREYEQALAACLGMNGTASDNWGMMHVPDALYSERGQTAFREALIRDGITVCRELPQRKKRRKK